MTLTSHSSLAALCAITPAIGCSAPHTFVSGHDADTLVSSLSDEEAIELCTSAFAHYDLANGDGTLWRALCVSVAIIGEDTAEACQMDLDACLASVPAGPTDAQALCEYEITASREGCTASVVDLEACITDSSALFADVLATSCEEAPT